MLEFEYAKALAEIVWKENDTLEEERIQTLQSIFRRAWYYQERGMLEEIILGFVQKKIKMIQQAETKGELQEIGRPPKPVYNGNGFTPGKYDTEEEELLVWSLTSLKAPLNDPAYKRYERSFKKIGEMTGMTAERCKDAYFYAIRKIRKRLGDKKDEL